MVVAMIIPASAERGWGPVRVPALEVAPARVASRARVVVLAVVPVGAVGRPVSAASSGAPVPVREKEELGPEVMSGRTVVLPVSGSTSSAIAGSSARSVGRSSGFLLRRCGYRCGRARGCGYPGVVVPNAVVLRGVVVCRWLARVMRTMRTAAAVPVPTADQKRRCGRHVSRRGGSDGYPVASAGQARADFCWADG